jgi:hypothetical protein
MTKRRTILGILGAFGFGILCGGGGAMLVAARQSAAGQENSVVFLEGLDLGALLDRCKPPKTKYVPARNDRLQQNVTTDESLRQMALPAVAIQVRWVGKTERDPLLDRLITRLRLHFGQRGFTLRLAQFTEQTTPEKATFDHRLYRCENSDGTCMGMISVAILTRDEKDCTVAIACASAGLFVRKANDGPI